MLAIVVTLGGYFAGLHWLISPPDPWQANARMQTTGSAHATAKKRPPAKPVEAAVNIEPATAKQSDIQKAAAETPPAVAMTSSAPVEPPVETAAVPRAPAQPAALSRTEEKPVLRAEARRPEPRREAREAKARPVHRKLAERSSSGRKLQLMVLRTYERADGSRFSRLLPLREARSVMAFQPDW
jgi:hypothetical protein